jgi:type VI secretion system FHA domain protein
VPILLKQGDKFRIGDYVIAVSVTGRRPADNLVNRDEPPDQIARRGEDLTHSRPANDARDANKPRGSNRRLTDPLADMPPDPPEVAALSPAPVVRARRGGVDPLATPSAGRAADLFPVRFPDPPPSPNWSGAPQSDHAPALSQAIVPPRVISPGRIDFDAIIGDVPGIPPTTPPAARTPAPPVAPQRSDVPSMPITADPLMPPEADPEVPRRQEQAGGVPSSGPATFDALAAFLEGAGVPRDQIDAADPEATLRAAGMIFRAMTEGFRQILRSRATVKRDMGIELTTIEGTDNNALKFSVTTTDAVRLLLSPGARGYIDPLDAALQAAADIEAHELAVMAGVQHALLSLLHRFDPDVLEKRMTSGMLSSALPAARKARNWDTFRQIYSDLLRESEDEFQAVFGRPFAKGYKAQTRRD